MLLIARFKISGHSMEPVIKNGQTVLVSNVPYFFSKPKIGDVVVFKKNAKVFVKRIAKINPSADANEYFLKGDNDRDSFDSKDFGWIDKKEIVGKIILKE